MHYIYELFITLLTITNQLIEIQIQHNINTKLTTTGQLSSGNTFVSGAGGLRFKSRSGQIEHSAATGSLPLQHFFERSSVARAQGRGDGPRKLVIRFRVTQRV